MSITYGFYDSLNGDRKYNALQMSSIFDGIITDGIFATVEGQFMVSARSGMTLTVAKGRGWFNHTWILNDAPFVVTLDDAHVTLPRIDAVVIDVDRINRVNNIIIVKGTPGSNASSPKLINEDDHKQYCLAHVTVPPGCTEISQSYITNKVGVTNGTPFVEGVLPKLDVEKMLAQWEAQWSDWLGDTNDDFNEWFEALRVTLEGDVATNLASRILSIEEQMDIPEMHRNIFRGKNLGSHVTSEQLAAIQNGTFDDLYIGDYWETNLSWASTSKVKWRIVDFDYWLGTGDTECVKHHVVIMPDDPLEPNMMHTSNPNYNGYASSKMRTNLVPYYNTEIKAQLGVDVISHREYLTNTVSENGYPSAGSWYDSTTEIPNEIMIFGNHIFAPSSNGSFDINRYTVCKTQLALFKLCPKFIVCRIPYNQQVSATGQYNRGNYWLRDVVNIRRYAFVSENGEASYTDSNKQRGIRPVFAIG